MEKLEKPTNNLANFCAGAPGFYDIESIDDMHVNVGHDQMVTIVNNQTVKIGGKCDVEVGSSTEEHYWGPFEVKYEADWKKVTVGATHNTFVGVESKLNVGARHDWVGGVLTEVVVGKKLEVRDRSNYVNAKGETKEKMPSLVELINEHKEYLDKQLTKAKELQQKGDRYFQNYVNRSIDAETCNEKFKKHNNEVAEYSLKGCKTYRAEADKIEQNANEQMKILAPLLKLC